MKSTNNRIILLIVAVGFLSPAFAQHNNDRNGGNQNGNSNTRPTSSSRQNNSQVSRQLHTPRQGNEPSVRPNNNHVNRPPDRQTTFSQPRQNGQNVNSGERNHISNSRNPNSNNNNTSVLRTNRGGIQNNTSRLNNTNRGNNINRGNNTYRGNNGSRNGYGYNQRGNLYYRNSFVPRRYSYAYYPHYSILPHTSISIYFGGSPYYYDNGLFYGYYNNYYEPIYAPFGIRIRTLPFGYYPFYIGPTPYYYYGGNYYRNYSDNEYEVVDAPLGAVITDLPKGAQVAMVNGEKFYEFNGTYYKEGVNSKNQVIYTVVGKNGEVNNSDTLRTTNNTTQGNVSSGQPLRVGDIIFTLPENCRQVVINGQNLYVSPDNVYFKQNIIDGSTTYEVVGTDSPDQQ